MFFQRHRKGFTLMEVLVSIALVGILFTPLLTFFSNSNRVNVNAKKMQRANTVAQHVMEEVRSYGTIEEMCRLYQDPLNNKKGYYRVKESSGSGSSSLYNTGEKNLCKDNILKDDGTFANTKYSFVRKEIESDGKKYSANIDVDTSVYQALNDTSLPVIRSLGAGSTVMAAESGTNSATMNALTNYYEKSRYMDMNILTKNLRKTIKVSITDTVPDSHGNNMVTEDMLRVKVSIEYSMESNDGITGCDGVVYGEVLYNEEVVYEALRGIYIFYNYDVYNDSQDIFQGIDVNVEYKQPEHSTWETDFKIYAIGQKVFSVNNDKNYEDEELDTYLGVNGFVRTRIKQSVTKGTTTTIGDNLIPVFSNFPYSKYNGGTWNSYNGNGMKDMMNDQQEKIQRLAAVTITLFDEEGNVCTTITSTRGE